jgi:hypothetical protein
MHPGLAPGDQDHDHHHGTDDHGCVAASPCLATLVVDDHNDDAPVSTLISRRVLHLEAVSANLRRRPT